MARRGYDGASTAEIARAAGLTPGLVHYHFADKREILLALVDDIAREAEERAQRALARVAGNQQRRLEAYLDAFLSLEPEPEPDPEAVACWVAVAAEAIREPRVRKSFAAAISAQGHALRGLVAGALRARRRNPREANAIAAALLATLQGYFFVSAAAPDAIPPGSAAPIARRLARALIEGEGP